MRKIKLYFLASFVCVSLLLQSWPTQASDFQSKTRRQTPRKSSKKKPLNPPVNADANTNELSEEKTKKAVKNWVYLCAPCHTVQATGTENGPPLLGAKAKRKFSLVQLKKIFAKPEDHGLSEAIPAFRKLNQDEREELAIWFSKLSKPEDIVVTTGLPNPPPFIFVQNCAGCHAPDATGNIGPNLHNVINRRNRETILKLINDPASVGITSNIMPTFSELSEEEQKEIVDWLSSLVTK